MEKVLEVDKNSQLNYRVEAVALEKHFKLDTGLIESEERNKE